MKTIQKTVLSALAMIFFLSFPVAAQEASRGVPVYISSRFGTVVARPEVKPAEEIKSKNVVKQKLDFSCGSAAVATIFNYYLNEKVSEPEVTQDMFRYGDRQNIIKNRGFSLLDIKKYAYVKGYEVNGYKTDLEGLVELGKPAIVTIVLGNYKHFVVFRGFYEGRVFLADPSLGNTILSQKEFEEMWYKNIALVIEPKTDHYTSLLEIQEEDEAWVKSDYIRKILLQQQIQNFRSPSEF